MNDESVARLPGISIIERFEPSRQIVSHDCLWFVLSMAKDPDLERHNDFWKRPFYFFRQRGHETVPEGKHGDIVIYGFRSREKRETQLVKSRVANHTGIFYKDKVRSKWGSGHIYEYDINAIPSSYGDSAAFFTKIRARY